MNVNPTVTSLRRIAKHSNQSNEHVTPPAIIEAARSVMSGIDLDPASSPLAQTFVKARRYYTRETNGLAQPWRGRIFLNPPGKEIGHTLTTGPKLFWLKLIDSFKEDAVEACYVAYSLEQLQQSQKWTELHMLKFAICIPNSRLSFYKAVEGRLVEERQPTHANAIVYLGHKQDRFREVFGKIGACL